MVFCTFLLACWLQGDMSWQSVFLPLQVLLFASARKKLLEIIYHDVGMLFIQCKSWDDLCLLESSVALDTASWDWRLHYSQIVLNVIGLDFGISHRSWIWESWKLTSGSVMLPVTGQAVWNTPSYHQQQPTLQHNLEHQPSLAPATLCHLPYSSSVHSWPHHLQKIISGKAALFICISKKTATA